MPRVDESFSADQAPVSLQGLGIGSEFHAVASRIPLHATRTRVNLVIDELGRSVQGFGMDARRIVAEDLDAGLGRNDLAAAL